MIPEHEFNKRLGRILRRWRKEKGIDQSHMAHLIGTTRQTITHLETANHTTCAKAYTLYQWAKETDGNPDTVFAEIDDSHDEDRELREVLTGTRRFTAGMLRTVHCLMYEPHGSNLEAFLSLMHMYKCLPMRDKQNISLLITNCYRTALERGEITTEHMPDVDFVEKCQKLGREAWIHDKDRYHVGD